MFPAFNQDLHYSQYFSSPLNLNPAQAGFFDKNYRMTAIHKNQWSSVTVPFLQISASIDLQMVKRKFHRDMFGVGVMFNSDKAGDSDFGTTQGVLALSYIKAINKRNNHFLSFAVSGAFAQRSINYANLVFDNQFNGEIFDPNLMTGEYFSSDMYTFYDINAGVHWLYKPQHDLSFQGGIAVFHINQPGQSLIEDEQLKLPVKFHVYGSSQFKINSKAELLPGFLWANQGPHNELLFGSRVKFTRSFNPDNYSAIYFGAFSRLVDAVSIMANFENKNMIYGLSYDINYSKLVPASHMRGGFELSIIYSFQNRESNKLKAVPCPIF